MLPSVFFWLFWCETYCLPRGLGQEWSIGHFRKQHLGGHPSIKVIPGLHFQYWSENHLETSRTIWLSIFDLPIYPSFHLSRDQTHHVPSLVGSRIVGWSSPTIAFQQSFKHSCLLFRHPQLLRRLVMTHGGSNVKLAADRSWLFLTTLIDSVLLS
jgi:hypothetical protein